MSADGLLATTSESGASAPTVGDYFLEEHWGGHSVRGPIVRVSERLLFTIGSHGRPSQSRRAEVLFVGAKEACERLKERITSSHALKNEERRAAEHRHQARVDALVAGAVRDGAASRPLAEPSTGPGIDQ